MCFERICSRNLFKWEVKRCDNLNNLRRGRDYHVVVLKSLKAKSQGFRC